MTMGHAVHKHVDLLTVDGHRDLQRLLQNGEFVQLILPLNDKLVLSGQ